MDGEKKGKPKALLIHTGGTLGMDPTESFDKRDETRLQEGTGGKFLQNLQSGAVLENVLGKVPELKHYANLEVEVPFNIDSARLGPQGWVTVAKIIHRSREKYDSFVVISGTDTLAFLSSALALMLPNLNKPVVVTGSQLPLTMPRSDARQNLIDSLTCATDQKRPDAANGVCVCFGGLFMRGSRVRKTSSSAYRAFCSPSAAPLAKLGVTVDWDQNAGSGNSEKGKAAQEEYKPRLQLNENVMRVPIVPGMSPMRSLGDVKARGVDGVVLEVFGVGNMPDHEEGGADGEGEGREALGQGGWMTWIREMREKGVEMLIVSQCEVGHLIPSMYNSGKLALEVGAVSGNMTCECACVKLMLCLANEDVFLCDLIADEM